MPLQPSNYFFQTGVIPAYDSFEAENLPITVAPSQQWPQNSACVGPWGVEGRSPPAGGAGSHEQGESILKTSGFTFLWASPIVK
jgi:hypothetical protein